VSGPRASSAERVDAEWGELPAASFADPYAVGDLSVVIPTRDRAGVLARTIAALACQSVGGFELIVVLDGMDQDHRGVALALEGPALAVASPGPPFRARVLRKPWGGPASARNAGAKQAEGRLLLFLGDDMIPEPDFVEWHLAMHNESLAWVASHGPSAGAPLVVIGGVRWHEEVSDLAITRWIEWSRSQFDFPDEACEDAGFGRFVSCNVSLPRDLFFAVGGFDEGFLYCYEDLDLAWRLSEKGARFAYEPAALASHLHRYDLNALESRWFAIGMGESQMAMRHPWFVPFFSQRIESAPCGKAACDERRRSRAKAWLELSRLTDRAKAALLEAGRRDIGPRTNPRTGGSAASATDLSEAVSAVASRATAWVRARADRACLAGLAGSFRRGWDAARELEELRSYLGDAFVPEMLAGHERAVEEELAIIGDEKTFYKSGRSYLYDLTAFAMSGTKVPYREVLARAVPPGAKLLDYGCGIGSDGLSLMEQGFNVSFADFASPSVAYLKWRLASRGLEAKVYDIERDHIPAGFDAVFAFDVLEHVDDPFLFLARLESLARLVVVNVLEQGEHCTLHRHLPVEEILGHAKRAGLVSHHLFHGRSHLLVYEASGSSSCQRRKGLP